MDSNLIVIVGLSYCVYILIATVLLTTIAIIKEKAEHVTLHWEDCDVVVHRTIARRFKN